MNQPNDELLIDLLEKRAVYGLTDEEQTQLGELGGNGDISFDLAASAVNLAELGRTEEMPASLRAKLVADANEFFAVQPEPAVVSSQPVEIRTGIGILTWLGWALAGAALVALFANIWLTRVGPPQQISGPLARPTPEQLTPDQMRERLLTSDTDLARANIGAGNVKEIKPIGDIVWSDAKQAGYVRVSGLPKNDPTKQTYQLWIFDETQDPKTPIDGGVFNVSSDGEVIIPINAKLQVKNPKLFAITIEKPGGVVVSKQEKVASLAKRET